MAMVAANCSKYGRLYTWAAAVDACPEGRHLPDTTEWNAFIAAVGGIEYAGQKLKADSDLWKHMDGISNDDSYGFSAHPAGDRECNGEFDGDGYDARFWSASQDEVNSNYAYIMILYYNKDKAAMIDRGLDRAYSVRCLKDK